MIMLLGAPFFKAMRSLIILQICFLPTGLAQLLENDRIKSLPGQPTVKFKQYGGYVTVDEKQQRDLFYYFVEAETDPHTKPLVLWLNGGPGCSSLAGAFFGHGPFMPKGEGLMRNKFSWNQEANMLFLESPAGVGFSYSSNKSFYNFINDEITARDSLKFLFGWLEKYPAYKSRDFFITGISYAGHYVPQLANLILQSRLKLDLKGIAAGNPLLEYETDFNIRADFLWSHGLISDSTYSMLNSICNISQIYRGLIEGNNSTACLQVYNKGNEEIGKLVDVSDVIIDVCLSSDNSQGMTLIPTGDGPDVCVNVEINKYLNRKDVQQALHAKLVGIDQWNYCVSNIGYDERDNYLPIIPLLGELVKAGVRVMIFSGDQDVVIPFMGTRILLNTLAKSLALNTTVPYRSWLQDKQVGGWTQVYGDILYYATVRGGGHDSAMSQPERTFLLFNTFLKGEPLPA